MVRVIAILYILLLGTAAVQLVPGYCLDSDNARQTKTLNGGIVDVDWVGQKIVVRWLQNQGEVKYDELTIFVPEDTRITKGTDTIWLSDLNIADQVTVEYYNSSPGPLKAISIRVEV